MYNLAHFRPIYRHRQSRRYSRNTAELVAGPELNALCSILPLTQSVCLLAGLTVGTSEVAYVGPCFHGQVSQ